VTGGPLDQAVLQLK
jgi:hypothetical protein